ncbi:nucleotidyl transferase AbiEii/AbiGii toxin family protein [Endozoicomonas acroporae]|uniref:nucleotidyl transferase AbiEii/AbiGii toxin family protein n=1 Tax=Endozoicomonas acroporae TaxID=1701104 RepID=UPI000C77A306
MDRSGYFYKQVQLLLQVLPFISKHSCFALKGGTAINLFVRNLPRLSVDIDLVYLPLKERSEALSDIRETLGEVSADLQTTLQGMKWSTSAHLPC